MNLELFYGDERLNKDKSFKQKLSEIEAKYLHWFQHREPKQHGFEHDMLHNHWQSYYDGHRIMFRFNEDCELPQEIKDECVTAFKEVYGS